MREADEQKTNIQKRYRYEPDDLAVSFYRVLKNRYGESSILGSKKKISLFSRKKRVPLNIIYVHVRDIAGSKREYIKGVRGVVEVEGLKTRFYVLDEGPMGLEPVIYAHGVPPAEQKEIEGLLEEVENYSIYKGQVVDVTQGIITLPEAEEECVVYNKNVEKQLEDHVWVILKNREECIEVGIKPQRKILLHGPFGSGKTLTLFQTARIAVENGWTVFYLPPSGDQDRNFIGSLMHVYNLARMYQPSVVCLEDIDREQRYENEYVFGQIQNLIDGLDSKGSCVVTLLTTNYPDKIRAALQRPGRIDKKIDFGEYSHDDIARLLGKITPPAFLKQDIDWHKVYEECKDFSPAFINEIGTAAKLMALSRAKRDNSEPHISTEILVEAAHDLAGQHKACERELGKF